MKNKGLFLCLAAAAMLLFGGCGEEPVDTSYTGSSIVIDSFTEIAGENPDDIEETDDAYCYVYEIKDGKVGAAAYNLYKDYLDANFTYSPLDSTMVGDGFCAVYYAANDARIEYTEAVDKHGSYRITVSVPK